MMFCLYIICTMIHCDAYNWLNVLYTWQYVSMSLVCEGMARSQNQEFRTKTSVSSICFTLKVWMLVSGVVCPLVDGFRTSGGTSRRSRWWSSWRTQAAWVLRVTPRPISRWPSAWDMSPGRQNGAMFWLTFWRHFCLTHGFPNLGELTMLIHVNSQNMVMPKYCDWHSSVLARVRKPVPSSVVTCVVWWLPSQIELAFFVWWWFMFRETFQIRPHASMYSTVWMM